MRLEHANLTVSDLAHSIDFYEKALGFEVRWQGKILNGDQLVGGAHVGPPGGDFYFSLFQGVEAGSGGPQYKGPGINHFGVVVDDLEAAREKILAAGAKIHTEYEYEPGHRIYFSDPDGIEIEIVQY